MCILRPPGRVLNSGPFASGSSLISWVRRKVIQRWYGSACRRRRTSPPASCAGTESRSYPVFAVPDADGSARHIPGEVSTRGRTPASPSGLPMSSWTSNKGSVAPSCGCAMLCETPPTTQSLSRRSSAGDTLDRPHPPSSQTVG